MTTVGIVGLGIMGLPMAKNLIKAGYKVKGYARRENVKQDFVKAGGELTSSVSQCCQEVDFFITVLPDSPDVKELVLGTGGALENMRSGTTYIDMSTISPQVSIEIADECRKVGIRPLDAPVSGGEQGAIDGILSIMVGGEAEDFAHALPIFQSIGKTVCHLGPSGSGQTVKAANQLIVAGIFGLVAESVVFLRSCGVDAEKALQVIGGGMAGNRILELRGQAMLNRDFKPGFRIDLHHKDMGILLDTARNAGAVIPLGTLAAQLVAAAKAQGEGEFDDAVLLKVIERLSGKCPD